MKLALTALALLSILTQGSRDLPKDSKALAKKEPVAITQTPTHRFVITHDLDFAFDTQTGQLCRTWDWEPANRTALAKELEKAHGESTPTCLNVYKAYPTKVVSNASLDLVKNEQ